MMGHGRQPRIVTVDRIVPCRSDASTDDLFGLEDEPVGDRVPLENTVRGLDLGLLLLLINELRSLPDAVVSAVSADAW
jgi:hypothetical protein